MYLLSGYQECNEYLIKNKSSKFRSEENTVINNEWKALLSGTFLPLSKNSKTSLATSVSPLIKTMWNQSPYYNKLTPVTYEGTSCVTGCVATTMAQIMKFWNYPDKGIGSHSYVISNRYYNWKGKTLTADFEKSYYQWNNMPIYLSDNSTSQQVDAVATLMLHAGISVDMMYSPSGSGAYSSRALLALKNYFNYSNDIEMKYRSNYTNDTDWLNLVKEQLSKGFPVYFSGNSSSSGHAFIADGYDSNNLIHFNLGWGGFFDGYYQITNPQGYSINQSVIINIKPPCSAPTGLTVSNISSHSATLAWNTMSLAQSYDVEYKPSADTEWIVATSSTTANSITLSDLNPNTKYSWRVKTNCSDSIFSEYSQYDFTTIEKCPTPTNLTISNLSTNDVIIKWDEISMSKGYTVEYKTSINSDWIVATTSLKTNTLTLSNLISDTKYLWRVKTNCSDSNFSEYNQYEFTTLKGCPAPTGLTISNLSTNGVYLKWNDISSALSYTLEYKASDEDKWTIIKNITSGSSLTLYRLKENTAYLWRIKTNCPDSKSSYVQGSFNTLSSCFSPSRLIASDITENSVNLRWNVISSALSYTLEYRASSDNEWTKTTVSNGDSSITLTGLKEKKRYYWRVKSNCSNSESSEYTENTFLTLAICPLPSGLATTNILTNSAILNWNAGKDNQTFRVEYKASDEDKWNVILLNTKGTSLILYGLKENTAYLWRIKTNCTDSKSPYVQGSFNTLSSCFSPSRLIASDITENSVNLRWNVISSALSYTLEYRASSDNEWTKTTVSNGDSSITLTGLKEKKRYYWRVKSNCSNSESSEYTENTFLTLAICPLPSGLATTNILTNSAILNWNAGKDNQTFRVEYKASDEDKWNVILLNTKGTSLILYGLKENTAYLWRIKTNCTDSKSSYVQGSFNTSSSMSDMLNDDFDTQNKKESKYSSISLYPNPVEEIVYIKGIEFKENDNLLITIIDRNGKIVKTVTVQPHKKITVDVSELTSNLYFLRIKDQTFKFIKK
ncbi:C10 family peptidase [Apibacter sp. HY039]|uniref:C10 family peptidase n=1 Tax=Apibacter sp. HY039 TaxID=2501476 RepID=UPI000FEBFB63|nr:C10 family peptidase [Apibacter sp. HY039]